MSAIHKFTASIAVAILAGCSRPPHEVTQSDVDSFLAKKEMKEQAEAWRSDIQHRAWKHPDGPRPLNFPDVAIVDQPMWDYTEHAIMQHGRRVWYWSDQATASTVSWATTSSMGTRMAIASTCFMPTGNVIFTTSNPIGGQSQGNWIYMR